MKKSAASTTGGACAKIMGGIVHLKQLKLKIEILACHWVIGIECDVIALDLCHCDLCPLVIGEGQIKTLTQLGCDIVGEFVLGNDENHVVSSLAICIGGRYMYLLGVADIHSHDRLFKSGDNLSKTKYELEWIVIRGSVKFAAIVKCTDILNTHLFSCLRLFHFSSFIPSGSIYINYKITIIPDFCKDWIFLQVGDRKKARAMIVKNIMEVLCLLPQGHYFLLSFLDTAEIWMSCFERGL